MVHLGLGAFHRAHQAWWTGVVGRDDPWGIAAFTGRSPAAATLLAAQDGLFTLLVRGPEGDQAELVSSVSRAVDGADTAAFTSCLGDPEVRVLTLTVTEAGYRQAGDGGLDFADPDVATDLAALRGAAPRGPAAADRARPHGRRAARAAAGDAGRWRMVPCDNLIGNGERAPARDHRNSPTRRTRGSATWIAEPVSFVSTAVDRITPRTTGEDLATVARLTGWADRAPVVTEPFREWVLAGEFPGGRPAVGGGGRQVRR